VGRGAGCVWGQGSTLLVLLTVAALVERSSCGACPYPVFLAVLHWEPLLPYSQPRAREVRRQCTRCGQATWTASDECSRV